MLSIEENLPSFAAGPHRQIGDRGPATLSLTLELADPEVVEELYRYPRGARRDEAAKTALRLGLLALRQAQGTLDADLVRRQTEDLLERLEQAVKSALVEQRERLLREFSLDERTSALCRLVREVDSSNVDLRDRLKGDLVDMRHEFSLDNGHGALARLRRELLALVDGMTATNDRFHSEVRSTLERMEVRREEAERTVQHGIDFENALGEALLLDCRARDEVLESCGATTGRIPRSKKGDFVITLGVETAAAGARIAVEAKEHQGFTLPMALLEIEAGRRNRDARVGLFVFSKKTAPEGLEPLQRHGQDVVAVWDREDPKSDVVLRAALSLARALSMRPGGADGPGTDFTEIDDALLRLGKRAEDLEQVATWAKTIEHNGLKIRSKAERIKEEVEEQLSRLILQMDGLRSAEL